MIEIWQRVVQTFSKAPQVKCRHKSTRGKSYTVLYHNLSTRLRANMATETKEKNDGNQISSISSIFRDMKTVIDDFRQGLLDYIEKSLARNWMNRMLSSFTLTQPILMRAQIPTGLTIMGIQLPQSKITGTKVPIIQMKIKVLQKGKPLKRIQIPQQESYLEIEKGTALWTTINPH